MSDIGEGTPVGGSLPHMLAQMLGDKAPNRVKRFLISYAIFETAWRVGKAWYQRGRSELTYNVSVYGDDGIYGTVHKWVLEQMPPKRRRALIAKTQHTSEYVDGRARRSGRLMFFFDGHRPQTLNIDGHRVRVSMVRDGSEDRRGGRSAMDEDDEVRGMILRSERIVFSVFGEEGRNAVLRFLSEIVDDHFADDRTPDLRIADKWGGWASQDLPERTIDQVALRSGQKERLVADLEAFLSAEEAYSDLGIPWHRGYMFQGPPGTGKTTIAKALANHFKLDMYYIPLADVEKDTNLLRLVSGIAPRSVLLLEDIDVFHAATSREESDGKGTVTLSGLLNALDGVATPHGLITMMTTNHPEVIDSAVVRDGRVDLVETVDFIDGQQLNQLVSQFVGRPVDLPDPPAELPPARVVGVLKEHIGDTEAALAAVKELVS